MVGSFCALTTRPTLVQWFRVCTDAGGPCGASASCVQPMSCRHCQHKMGRFGARPGTHRPAAAHRWRAVFGTAAAAPPVTAPPRSPSPLSRRIQKPGTQANPDPTLGCGCIGFPRPLTWQMHVTCSFGLQSPQRCVISRLQLRTTLFYCSICGTRITERADYDMLARLNAIMCRIPSRKAGKKPHRGKDDGKAGP